MSSKRYLARIRWRSPQTSALELETEHGPFASAEEAALFANGLVTPGVDRLCLGVRGLELILTDGRGELLDEAKVKVWAASEPDAPESEGWAFFLTNESMWELFSQGFGGELRPREFLVVGEGNELLDVSLEVDTGKEVVQIRVTERAPSSDDDPELGSVGVVPRA